MDEVNEPAGQGPQALAPADEAMLARAQTLRELTEAALGDVAQHYPVGDPGRLLRDALFLQGLVDRLVDQAVVAERERGASWTDIGSAANSSRQAAHERWNSDVGAWVLMGRQRTGIGRGPADPTTHAQYLDEWYAELAGVQRAVSVQLPSLGDEHARAQANAWRAEARQLHARAEQLRKEIDAAYDAALATTGTDAAKEKREVWAAKHLARAAVYERLAVVEEPVAPEHRRRAASQRSLAQDIARDDAPESLPADEGTRQQVHAAYLDLTDKERRSAKRAVAELIAERLGGVGVDSVRRHLDAVIEAERMSYVLDIAACSDPKEALSTAVSLLQDYAKPPNSDFWHSLSCRLLSCYLMAAALSDARVDTLYRWISHPDDRRPVELLRSGPVPQWADDCEQILSSHPKTRDNVLITIESALQYRVPQGRRAGR